MQEDLLQKSILIRFLTNITMAFKYMDEDMLRQSIVSTIQLRVGYPAFEKTQSTKWPQKWYQV